MLSFLINHLWLLLHCASPFTPFPLKLLSSLHGFFLSRALQLAPQLCISKLLWYMALKTGSTGHLHNPSLHVSKRKQVCGNVQKQTAWMGFRMSHWTRKRIKLCVMSIGKQINDIIETKEMKIFDRFLMRKTILMLKVQRKMGEKKD